MKFPCQRLSFWRWSATLSLLLLGPLALCAQVVVKGGRLPVAIDEVTGARGSEASALIRKNLKRGGSFDFVEQDRAQFLVTIDVGDGNAEGTVKDLRSGANVLEKNFTSASWRRSVNELCDAITERITGIPGIASTRLAFVSSRTGSKEIYTMDLDGNDIVQMTQDRAICGSPALSRDRGRLAYTSYKSGYPDVYVQETATGKRLRVAFFPGINSGASFSPDGNQIALTLSKDGNPEVYIMSSAGGPAARITRTAGAESSPSWAPDGNRLVYASDERGSPQLFVQRLDGRGRDRIETGFLFATEPDWSPDGKFIAFNARIAGKFQVCVFDLASKQSRQLTTNYENEDPAWCRDSRHIVFSREGRLILLNSATDESEEIEVDLQDCVEPSCSE